LFLSSFIKKHLISELIGNEVFSVFSLPYGVGSELILVTTRFFPQGSSFKHLTLCCHCHPINRLPTWYTITATSQPMANVYSAIKTGQRADFVSLATMASVAAHGV
jgi:hypothetical protein